MNTEHISLAEAEQFLQSGYWSREQTVNFVRDWNAGPHFTQAVVTDTCIRNFDPETCRLRRHLYKECGVKD